MTDTTRPEMRRAVELDRPTMLRANEAAEQYVADGYSPHGSVRDNALVTISRALLQANAEVERMRAIVQCIEHDIAIVTQHRDARQSGGQHVGTGGPLGAANPSMLAYLERVVRDMRATQNATTSAAAGRGGEK